MNVIKLRDECHIYISLDIVYHPLYRTLIHTGAQAHEDKLLTQDDANIIHNLWLSHHVRTARRIPGHTIHGNYYNLIYTIGNPAHGAFEITRRAGL